MPAQGGQLGHGGGGMLATWADAPAARYNVTGLRVAFAAHKLSEAVHTTQWQPGLAQSAGHGTNGRCCAFPGERSGLLVRNCIQSHRPSLSMLDRTHIWQALISRATPFGSSRMRCTRSGIAE